jgi:amino acid adenylation domain-containing protein
VSSADESRAFAERIAELSPAKRALLERMVERGAGRARRPERSVFDKTLRPLSFAQQRHWILDQLNPGDAAYSRPAGFRLSGPLDRDVLERCLTEIVRRHEVLRATFPAVDGRPEQRIAPPSAVPLPLVDVSDIRADFRDDQVRALAVEAAEQPFDLAAGPLVRATLYRLDEEEHVLLVVFHHIVFDAWSSEVLWRELAVLYPAFASGEPTPLAELPIQYADVAAFERRRLAEGELDSGLAYWRRQLEPPPAQLRLPTERPASAVYSSRGGRCSTLLPTSLVDALRALAREEGATLFMVLLAAWQTLLHRISGEVDVAVGTPVAGRSAVDTEALIGCFVNTLVLRTDLSADPSFRALIARVRGVTLGAYAHEEVPFDRVAALTRADRTPFFRVFLNLHSVPKSRPASACFDIAPFEVATRTAKFDISLDLAEESGGIAAVMSYASELFDEATIERLLDSLRGLLEAIVADPDRRLSELAVLPERERHRILVDWNRTAEEYPTRTVHELFAQQAARTPDAVALVQGERRRSYRDLDAQANRLAHFIRERRADRGAPVAVFLDRSIEATTALLGVLKAGAAFLPLDPSYPPDRTAYMLADSGAALVLTEERLAPRLPATDAAVIALDALAAEIARRRADVPQSDAGVDDAAYVIYTSGSTGKPKGVVGLHRGIVNRVAWSARAYPFASGEVACQKTAPGFVDSIAEIFGPLVAGVPTVILADDAVKDPWGLVRSLSDARVSRIVLVPGLLRGLLEMGEELRELLPRLTLWMTSGEALNVELARRFATLLPHARLVNVYGSSEVAADATSYEVPAVIGNLATIPIGRPIANTVCYLLDDCRRPVPIGVAGELYVGGHGLARCYLGQPELTDERFVPNPFGDAATPRLYRTGDLGRYRADGDIEFLGRNDDQVKVRGVRVEVAEVEAALEAHPLIRAAAVVVFTEPSSNQRIVAYLVTAAGASPSPVELRAFLGRTLVPQMVPTVFVRIEALPLTPSGKLDRRALPVPAGPSHEVASIESPRGPTEEKLARIWGGLLGVERVGVHQDFFDLGGDSLLAVRLFARIHATFETQLPVAALFEASTVAQLAHVIDEGPAPIVDPTLIPLQPMGQLPPLFLAPGIGNENVAFIRLARRLAPDRPVFGMVEGYEQGARSVGELADEFAKKIRRFRPVGPYHLGGYSSGSSVVIEVARRLRAEGASVGVVAILDHPNPASGYHAKLPWRPTQFVRFLSNLARWLRQPGNLKMDYLVRGMSRKARYLWKVLMSRMGPLGVPQPQFELADVIDAATYPDRWREQMSAALAARRGFTPEPYPGPLTLFHAEIRPFLCSFDPHLGWSDVASGGLELHEVSGNHVSMLHEPQVQSLARQLSDCLLRFD